MNLLLLFTISLSIPVCLSYSRKRGSQQFSYNRKSAKFTGEQDNKDMRYFKNLDSIDDDSVYFSKYPSKKILPSGKDGKETVIIRDRGIPVGVAEGVAYQKDDGVGEPEVMDLAEEEEKEIAYSIKPQGTVRQTLLMAQSRTDRKHKYPGNGERKYPRSREPKYPGSREHKYPGSREPKYSDVEDDTIYYDRRLDDRRLDDRDQQLDDMMYSDETQDTADSEGDDPQPRSYENYDGPQSDVEGDEEELLELGDTSKDTPRSQRIMREDAETEAGSEGTVESEEELLSDVVTRPPAPETEPEPVDVEEPDLKLTKAELAKVSKEVEEPRLEPLEDWNYLRIRDLLSQLNNALHAYSNKLTKDILRGRVFQTKSIDCITKYSTLFSECKSIIQDKITLQQELDDLRNRYTSLEQVLAKVKDINEDNRQTIDKLRANRDQCVREDAEKVKTINSLRSRAMDLRRKLARFRGSIKQ